MRYYSTQRPISPGTFPKSKPVQEVVNFDERQFIEEIGKLAWGYINYAESLSRKEVEDYELVEVAGAKAGKEEV